MIVSLITCACSGSYSPVFRFPYEKHGNSFENALTRKSLMVTRSVRLWSSPTVWWSSWPFRRVLGGHDRSYCRYKLIFPVWCKKPVGHKYPGQLYWQPADIWESPAWQLLFECPGPIGGDQNQLWLALCQPVEWGCLISGLLILAVLKKAYLVTKMLIFCIYSDPYSVGYKASIALKYQAEHLNDAHRSNLTMAAYIIS